MDSLILDSGNELHCQFCNGALNIMGILGNLEYFRCENCGMEFSVNLSLKEIKLKEEEKEEKEDILYYYGMEDDSLI